MEGKLGLHDLIARLFPGCFFLWALRTLVPGYSEATWIPTPGEVVVFVPVAYLVGMLAYDLSNYIERPLYMLLKGPPSRTYLLRKENHHILNALQQIQQFQFLKSIPDDYAKKPESLVAAQDLAERAHSLALATHTDNSAKLLAVHAQYHLHRTLFIVLLLLLLAVISQETKLGVSLIMCGILAAMFFVILQAARWNNTTSKVIFDAALASTKGPSVLE